MRTVLKICLLMLATSMPSSLDGQEGARPEILILGTYHMANPGRDVHNLEADDVLAPRRQAEIAELIEVLARYRPTKIAVEANVSRRTIQDRYQRYLADEYELSRNEIDQLGLRLARELGHATVHAVDEDGDFPYYRVRNYAIANRMEARFDSMTASGGSGVRRMSEYMRTHTVLEILQTMNADSSVTRAVGAYYGYVPFGEPYEYAGPDLIASWFQRNIRIYHNIRALVTSPDDRILVIYGAGHLGWLQRMVQDDPAVRQAKLSDLTSG